MPDTQEPEIGKKAKHKKDQTEMRISKMRVGPEQNCGLESLNVFEIGTALE